MNAGIEDGGTGNREYILSQVPARDFFPVVFAIPDDYIAVRIFGLFCRVDKWRWQAVASGTAMVELRFNHNGLAYIIYASGKAFDCDGFTPEEIKQVVIDAVWVAMQKLQKHIWMELTNQGKLHPQLLAKLNDLSAKPAYAP